MATNFGTTLAVNGLGREITTWGFRIKDGLFSVNPYVCWSLSLWIHSCGGRNCWRRTTIRLGIDTLIANMLVLCKNVKKTTLDYVNGLTQQPSHGILVHPTVWSQYTNVTDMQAGQTVQRSRSTGRTVTRNRHPKTAKNIFKWLQFLSVVKTPL